MGSKKNVDMSTTEDTVKIVEVESPVLEGAEGDKALENSDKPAKKAVIKNRPHSKKYFAAKRNIDRTRIYDPEAAVELVKKLSYSKFPGTITLDGVVRDEGDQGVLTFPHSTGKTRVIAIVDDALIEKIEAGVIEFDVLITEPKYMAKIAKFARVLGPRGLMPNPKQGTVTPNPELKKKELERGKVTIKSERKFPVIHVTLGKTDMETTQIVENMRVLFSALKGKLKKAAISATMSPSVKVDVSVVEVK
ncbi:MAG: hypothetical protein WAU07_00920 [Microgenomates group bacterium]